MKFYRELDIYGDNTILKRFEANETDFEIVQGKISAIISESEIDELINSDVTMYSKLASAIFDINSLTLNFSDLTTKYNTLLGSYEQLDSKVAEYKLSVDGLSATISSVQTDLDTNYSTTSQMNAAIKASTNSISSEVSSLRTTLQNNYSTTTSMNSAINQSANGIKQTVAATYTTKNEFSSTTSRLNTLISQVEDDITLQASSISNLNGSLESLSAQVSLNSNNISLKVNRDDIITEINASPERLVLKSNRLVIDSTEFKLTEDGKLIVDADNFKIDSSGNVFVTGSGYFNGTFDVSIPYLNLGDYIIDFDSGVITMGLRLDDSDDPELPPASSITIGQFGCAFNSGSNLDLYAAANVTISSGGYGDIEFTGADVYFSNDIDVSGEMRIAGDINSQGGINTYGNVNVDADFYSLSVPENGNRNDSNGIGQPGRAVVTDLNHFVCFEWITYMGTNWLNGFVDVTSLGAVQFNQ